MSLAGVQIFEESRFVHEVLAIDTAGSARGPDKGPGCRQCQSADARFGGIGRASRRRFDAEGALVRALHFLVSVICLPLQGKAL